MVRRGGLQQTLRCVPGDRALAACGQRRERSESLATDVRLRFPRAALRSQDRDHDHERPHATHGLHIYRRNLIDSVVQSGVPRANFLHAARFDSTLLDAADSRVPRSLLFDLIELAIERQLLKSTDGLPYSERVRDLLMWQRPPGDLTMAAVAKQLRISVRSLRRHLTVEGKPYPEIVNESLAAIAKAYLCDERRSIWQTAIELGFSDNTSFHRAFKRWTGLTPFEFRRRQLLAPRIDEPHPIARANGCTS
jgi:AraC-like DNA-binding protein